MSKRLSPTRRLFNKYTELQEQMHVLVTHDGSDEAKVKLSRVERRFWPIQEELLRRLDERDELLVKAAAWDAREAHRVAVGKFGDMQAAPGEQRDWGAEYANVVALRSAMSSADDRARELVAEKADRISRLQAIHAANSGVKPWSSDQVPA